jgi:hypothetical protein
MRLQAGCTGLQAGHAGLQACDRVLDHGDGEAGGRARVATDIDTARREGCLFQGEARTCECAERDLPGPCLLVRGSAWGAACWSGVRAVCGILRQ